MMANWRQRFSSGDALLVVDVQNDFCEGGALGVPDANAIIPVVNEALQAAARDGALIFFSRDWHRPGHMSFKEHGGPWPAHCIGGQWGSEFHPDLQIPLTAKIISKATDDAVEEYSAMKGVLEHQPQQTVAEYLLAAQIKRVWVMGLALDYCVKYTALDLVQSGFETLIYLPATRAICQDERPQLLQEFVQAGIHLVEE